MRKSLAQLDPFPVPVDACLSCDGVWHRPGSLAANLNPVYLLTMKVSAERPVFEYILVGAFKVAVSVCMLLLIFVMLVGEE